MQRERAFPSASHCLLLLRLALASCLRDVTHTMVCIRQSTPYHRLTSSHCQYRQKQEQGDGSDPEKIGGCWPSSLGQFSREGITRVLPNTPSREREGEKQVERETSSILEMEKAQHASLSQMRPYVAWIVRAPCACVFPRPPCHPQVFPPSDPTDDPTTAKGRMMMSFLPSLPRLSPVG